MGVRVGERNCQWGPGGRAAAVRAFNERHNSAEQRAWFLAHVQAWALSQPKRWRKANASERRRLEVTKVTGQQGAHEVAAELVDDCRWLVRGTVSIGSVPVAPPRSDSARPQFGEAAAEQTAGAVPNDGGTGAVLLLESLCLEDLALACLPAGLVVGGGLEASECFNLVQLPLRIGWSLNVRECHELWTAGLAYVGGSIQITRCDGLRSLSASPLERVCGSLNLFGCPQLKELPPKLKSVQGDMNVVNCGRLTRPPGSPALTVEGKVHSRGSPFPSRRALTRAVPAAEPLSTSPTAALGFGAALRGTAVRGLARLARLPQLLRPEPKLAADLTEFNGYELRIPDDFAATASLPDGLREIRHSLLVRSDVLERLPDALHVGHDLSWTGAAVSLPSGLRVGGCLELKGHPGLTEIPDDIRAGGDVTLRGLAALRRLPEGLAVVHGDLVVDGCRGLDALPEDLHVDGDLELRGLDLLGGLPAGLFVGGRLFLTACPLVDHIPSTAEVRSRVVSHNGVSRRLPPRRLLDRPGPGDFARCVDALLPVIFGFLRHGEVRYDCALVCSAWAAAATPVSPCCLNGSSDAFFARLMTDDYFGTEHEKEECHFVPTVQWEHGPHLRFEKMWALDPAPMPAPRPALAVEEARGELYERVGALAVATEHFAALCGSPLAALKVGDEFGPLDLEWPDMGDCVGSSTATVTAVSVGTGKVMLDVVMQYPKRSYGAWSILCEHPNCTCVSSRHVAFWEETQHQPVQEGVSFDDDLSLSLEDGPGDGPSELLRRLQASIDALAASRPADYRPGVGGMLRDHVHPGLSAFAFGTSPFEPSEQLSEAQAPDGARRARIEEEGDWGRVWNNFDVSPNEGFDTFCRPYAASAYQWLPTYFDVGAGGGTVTIRGNINNLCPRDRHEPFYGSLAELFQSLIPHLDIARAYARAVPLTGRMGDARCRRWRGRHLFVRQPGPSEALQVVTEIVDYELQPGQTCEDDWRVEGSPHEHILCTGLCVLDRDAHIDGGEVLFKRAFLLSDASRVDNYAAEFLHHATLETVEECLVPLGKVATPAGRRLAFPNSHVHRLSKLENTGTTPGRLRIVAFHVVDPEVRIISTQECPDQTATMTREQALQRRLDFMEERRAHTQDWNARFIHMR